MDKEDWEAYLSLHKDNEERRLSFNQRQERWQEYLKTKLPKRSETSFDLNKF